MSEKVVWIVKPGFREKKHLDSVKRKLKDRYMKRVEKVVKEFGELVEIEEGRAFAFNRAAERLYVRGEAPPTGISEEMLMQLIKLSRSGARLAGPQNEHEADELAAKLHAESPWMSDATNLVWEELLQRASGGLTGSVLPPILLLGPPGVGKSHWARALGRLSGCSVRMIDAGAGSANFRVSGLEKGWGQNEPSVPVAEILKTRIANPVMIVDEIDKAPPRNDRGPPSLAAGLLQVLEPGTAKAHECTFLRTPFDISHVSWVLTANYVERIPPELINRCRVIEIGALTIEGAASLLEKRGFNRNEVSIFLNEFGPEIESGRLTARRLAQMRPPSNVRLTH